MDKQHINIPDPCQKVRWDDMAKTTAGGHCAVCDRTVVDFTGLDKAQIIKALSCGNKVCGNFSAGQLEQLNAPVKINTSWWRRMAAAAVVLVCSLPFLRSEAKDRSGVAPYLTKDQLVTDLLAPDTVRLITITGNVTDTTKGTVTGAIIASRGQKYKAQTDMKGNFKLSVPDTTRTLTISCIGYHTQKILIDTEAHKPLRIVLKTAPTIMGEVRITPP